MRLRLILVLALAVSAVAQTRTKDLSDTDKLALTKMQLRYASASQSLQQAQSTIAQIGAEFTKKQTELCGTAVLVPPQTPPDNTTDDWKCVVKKEAPKPEVKK